MMLASCSVPLLGLVDTAILGHLEHPRYLAAVAAGGSIMTFIGWIFAFLRMGNTGLTAQAVGNQDKLRNREIMRQSLTLGACCGLFLVVLHIPLLQLAVHLITPSPDIQGLTYQYCQIRIFAAPATLTTSAALGWLLGNGRAKSCVAILLVTNVTNILLDFLLIKGLGMNSEGAAWASFCAEWIGLVVAIWRVFRVAQDMPSASSRGLFSVQKLKPLLEVNRQLFYRTCCIVFTMAFFHAQGARLGNEVLAANAILIQLLLLVAYTQDGFANAAEALTGQAIGAGRMEDFFETCRQVVAWGFLLAVIATVILAFWPEQIINLFTNIPQVLDVARQFWPWLTLLPLASAYCFMADGIFIGAGKTRDMLYTTLIATLLIYLPTWTLTRSWGNHGLWMAYLLFLLSRSLLMGYVFHRHSKMQRWIPAPLKPALID